MTFSSCSKDELVDDLQNAPKPSSEFVHTVSIDDAEAQLVGLLSDLEGAATRSSESVKPRKIASRYSMGAPIATRAIGDIDTNKGPMENWSGPYIRSSGDNEVTESESTPNNFQYNMTTVIGIRK